MHTYIKNAHTVLSTKICTDSQDINAQTHTLECIQYNEDMLHTPWPLNSSWPVQRHLKFSQVLGQTSVKSSNTIRPPAIHTYAHQLTQGDWVHNKDCMLHCNPSVRLLWCVAIITGYYAQPGTEVLFVPTSDHLPSHPTNRRKSGDCQSREFVLTWPGLAY